MNQLLSAGRMTGILLFICICNSLHAQTICQTGGENATLTFTAPAGMVFTSVTFASYGTPNGSCGSFTIGGCHAANSKTIVENALLGRNSASISASNGVFGDPCGGTVKRLYVEAVYGTTLPLKWLSFTAQKQNENVLLQWSTASEVNVKDFEVERSNDGKQWKSIGNVLSNNNNERSDYHYTDASPLSGVNYYRIKQNDRDAHYSYSEIRTVRMNDNSKSFQVISNSVTNRSVQLKIENAQTLCLFSSDGRMIWSKELSPGIHSININQANGIYFLKSGDLSQKLVIQ